ncbi:MAG TPA: hypothetical protein PLF38_03315, partial [Xylanibacter oryzae]|nr:hypothetical protein [Xylanibacter oryzae]
MKIIILLSACIDPKGMSHTYLIDKREREKQYIDTLNFYLEHTKLDIVFTENSGNDISGNFEKFIEENRLEILTYKTDSANRFRGKGYEETEIIEYALNYSKKIDEECILIKITGRIIIENINNIITSYKWSFLKNTIQCNMNSNFSFADSKIIIAPSRFYRKLLINKIFINDSKGQYLEHILSKTIKEQHLFYYS